MDYEKLSLKPTEIDKNTGRIVLPKSQEELDRLAGRASGMNVSTKVTAYLPAHQRPVYPQAGVRQHAPSDNVALTSPSPTSFWQHPFYGVLGFCALVAAVPLGFFCFNLIRENDQLTRQLGKLENRNALLQAKMDSPTLAQAYAFNALDEKMQRIRDEVAELSENGFEIILEEEQAPLESAPANTPSVENQSPVDEDLGEPVPQASLGVGLELVDDVDLLSDPQN